MEAAVQELIPIEPSELRAPTSAETAGLPQHLLDDIVLRAIAAARRCTAIAVADRIHASVSLVEDVVRGLRDRRLVEYDGMDGRSYLLGATDAGSTEARRRSDGSRYIGPIPVTLDLYRRVVRSQVADLRLRRDRLSAAFDDLVLPPAVLDQLGPAICSDGAIFLYGPPGTGKSSIAERIVRAHEDTVLVPHCLELQGEIITVFDPLLHTPVPDPPRDLDPRWVVCHRPSVITGGELHSAMLDLMYEPESGTYLAPLQLKANNGILVIDDFGRQAMTPEELLNRWIVPLDRQIDYLTLGGRKFEVPFEVKVVLSTNLDPDALGDEAFFRRIENKVRIGCLDEPRFIEVLHRVAAARGLALTDESERGLLEAARTRGDGGLRAYLPGVVCKLAAAICRFEELPEALTPELLGRALDMFFTNLSEPDPDATTHLVELGQAAA
jgi:hypothetical protein